MAAAATKMPVPPTDDYVDVGAVTMEELSILYKVGYTTVGFDIVPKERKVWERFLYGERIDDEGTRINGRVAIRHKT